MQTLSHYPWGRMKSAEEFQRVLHASPRRKRTFLQFFCSESTSGENALGFILPKRHIKLCVLRNKIKRVVSEFLRLQEPRKKTALVIKATQQINKKNFQEKLDDLLTQLKNETNLLDFK